MACSLLSIRCTGHMEEGAGKDSGGQDIGGSGGAAGAGTGGNAGSGNTTTSSGGSGQAGSGSGSSGSGGAGNLRDAGSSTAGRGPDAAPQNPCAGRIVCDDFEKAQTGQAPAKPWVVRATQGKATVLVDETRAFSGTHSVKVTIAATTASDTYRQAMVSINGAPLIPLANNMVYGRFLIYTDRIPDKSVHWTIAHGDGPRGTLSATYNYGGMGGLMANYYRNTTPDPTDCWQTKDVMFPTNKWTCVAFQFDGMQNEMRYWQDGVEIPELHVVGNNKTDMTCTVKGVDGRWLGPAPPLKHNRGGGGTYPPPPPAPPPAWRRPPPPRRPPLRSPGLLFTGNLLEP